MVEREQYTIDILSSMAERTVKRLWVLIIMLLFLLGVCGAAIYSLNKDRIDAINARIDAINELRELESSIETVYEYEVEQEADDYGRNYVVSGDFYGETNGQSEENSQTQDGR